MLLCQPPDKGLHAGSCAVTLGIFLQGTEATRSDDLLTQSIFIDHASHLQTKHNVLNPPEVLLSIGSCGSRIMHAVELLTHREERRVVHQDVDGLGHVLRES